MDEHRSHQRARVLLPVRVRVGGSAIDAVATDVSVGGLFILDDARIARAETAQVEVSLDESHTVCAEARIVRHQHPERPRGLDVPGIGLRFIALPREAITAIASLVKTRAA